MADGTKGLLGRKMGMTQLYTDDGTATPVTVIDLNSNVVVGVKSSDGKDGYDAVQIGFDPERRSRTTKPRAGVFAKAGVAPRKHIREFRMSAKDTAGYEPGQPLSVAEIFNVGDRIDVSGTSKGRGFSGVVKKFGFAGFERTHGTHEFFRHGGSIGTRLTPGHVIKGKRMPGQLGNERATVQNIRVVKIDEARNLLFVCGGVPGANGGLLEVRAATKS